MTSKVLVSRPDRAAVSQLPTCPWGRRFVALPAASQDGGKFPALPPCAEATAPRSTFTCSVRAAKVEQELTFPF